MVETPVLFAPFARPEYARRTFEAIKKARPKKLYWYSDKAREDNLEEIDKNNQTRDLINEINWPCDLKTYFREKNVGSVYISLFNAFDWIFENEEEAIILEEDCVPSLAFFDFCDQLIPKFKKDHRIWVISGNNFNDGYNPNGYDYFYSYFPYLWGWATWKDRWNKVFRGKLPYEEIKTYKLFEQIYVDRKAARNALRTTKQIIETPTWDYRFTISMKCNGGLGIIPKTNLVSNIGIFGSNNSGKETFFHNRKLPDFDNYIINISPPFVVSDYGYSHHWFRHYFLKSKPLIFKIIQKFVRLIRGAIK